MQPLLFERYPSLARIPWVGLATLPTPVQRLELSGSAFWIKRDDLTSPLYGGNKVRKLEFILARARAQGATRLITVGAAGSHHALATTLFGKQLSFAVTLVLFPQPLTEHVRAVLLMDQALGADLRFVPRMTSVPAGVMRARLSHFRERAFIIAAGGSDAHGTLGYINATLELAEQMPELPELIVVAAGTMGTVAGIAIGLELLQRSTRVAAIRITSKLVANERALGSLIRATCALLQAHGLPVDPARAAARVELVHNQLGLGYGKTTAAADAAQNAFREFGIELDVSYTAKAAAELLARCRSDAQVLYWHTLSGTMPQITPAEPAQLPPPFRRYLQQVESQ